MTDTTPKETSMTDHTMLAEADLDTAARAIRRSDLTEVEVITATLALAQVRATLALTEQQRLANLVALRALTGETTDSMHPDIAAALGIEAVDHD